MPIEGAVAEPPSLHEVVADAYEEVEAQQPEEPKRDASERARDEAGRFAAAEKAKAAAKDEEKGSAPEAKATKEAAPASAYTPPKRPQSWKAELDKHWGTLHPEVHAEIMRRESDYAKGVSTYKGEYDRLKPLGEALKPYEQMMTQAGITPDKFIHALASTHQTLTGGDKETKLRRFAQFAQEYQIPLHELFIMGEDGKVNPNQQYFQAAQPQQPQGLTREEARQEAQQVWLANERQRQLREFVGAKDSNGSPRYPHFEALKPAMDGLLRAGLARDLPTAYDAALRLPEHSALYDELNKQQIATQNAAKAQAEAAAAKKAKENRISARPQTPTGTAGNGGPRTLREAVEASVEEHDR